MAAVRTRVGVDQATPWWIRILMPAVARFHARKADALMHETTQANPMDADRRSRVAA